MKKSMKKRWKKTMERASLSADWQKIRSASSGGAVEVRRMEMVAIGSVEEMSEPKRRLRVRVAQCGPSDHVARLQRGAAQRKRRARPKRAERVLF